MIQKRLPFIKTIWRELYYRPQWYADNHGELERLFRWSEDPWNFRTSPYERDRLQALLGLVQRYPHDTILEVGCGEGVFTQELEKIAHQVVAIDVSPTAIARARQRCSGTTFFSMSMENFTWDVKFDQVICAETLYYIRDIPAAIAKLSRLGKFCVVSYIQRESKVLDPHIMGTPLIEYSRFEKSYWVWKRVMTMALWHNNGSQ